MLEKKLLHGFSMTGKQELSVRFQLASFWSLKDEKLGLVLVSRLKASRLSVLSRLAPIFIIDKSQSLTHLFVYLSRSLGPGLVQKYWISAKFVKFS